MAKTILQRWSELFGTEPQNAPDANQNKSSSVAGGANTIRNSFNKNAMGMNNWDSAHPVQRNVTGKIGMLYNFYLGDEGVGAADITITTSSQALDSGDQSINSGVLGMGNLSFDGGTYSNLQGATSKVVTQIASNNNIRYVGATDAINAFFAADEGERFTDFFAAIPEGDSTISRFVKNNYRLGVGDPSGNFGRFTAHAFTDTSNDGGAKLSTTKLDTLAPTQ